MAGSSAEKKGSIGKAGSIGLIIIILCFIALTYRSCSEDSSEERTSDTFKPVSKPVRTPQSASLVTHYTPVIPDGGMVSAPAKNANGAYSIAVRTPSGFTMCADADRGSGSFSTQSQNQATSDDWRNDSGPSIGNRVRFQSNGPSQDIRYHFVPEGAKC